jgi:hypothetical protein
MAHATTIKRVVNALVNQHRIILHLDCGHNDSIPELRFVHEPELDFTVGDVHICPWCQDLPKPQAEPASRDEFDALFKEPLL